MKSPKPIPNPLTHAGSLHHARSIECVACTSILGIALSHVARQVVQPQFCSSLASLRGPNQFCTLLTSSCRQLRVASKCAAKQVWLATRVIDLPPNVVRALSCINECNRGSSAKTTAHKCCTKTRRARHTSHTNICTPPQTHIARFLKSLVISAVIQCARHRVWRDRRINRSIKSINLDGAVNLCNKVKSRVKPDASGKEEKSE